MRAGKGRLRERSIIVAVFSMPSMPCTPSGSVWVGTTSWSAAASALTINRPSVGGQSSRA